MALVPAICTECGAQINIDDSKEAGICTHCGTAFITEKAINNYVTNNTTNITNNVTKIIYGNEKEEGEDFYNRALTYIKLDDKNKAKSELEKAIELNPEKALYRIQLFDLNMNSIEDFYNLNSFKLTSYTDAIKLCSPQDVQMIKEQFGYDLTTVESALTSLFFKYFPHSDSEQFWKNIPNVLINEILNIDNSNEYKQNFNTTIKNKLFDIIADTNIKSYNKEPIIRYAKNILSENDAIECIDKLHEKYQTLYHNIINAYDELLVEYPEYLPDDLNFENEKITGLDFKYSNNSSNKVFNSFILTPKIKSINGNLQTKVIKIEAGIEQKKIIELLNSCISEHTELIEFDESYTNIKFTLKQNFNGAAKQSISFNPNLVIYSKNFDAYINVNAEMGKWNSLLKDYYSKCVVNLGFVKGFDVVVPEDCLDSYTKSYLISRTKNLYDEQYAIASEKSREYNSSHSGGGILGSMDRLINHLSISYPSKEAVLSNDDFMTTDTRAFYRNIENHLSPEVFEDRDAILSNIVARNKSNPGLFKRLFGKKKK